MFPAGQRGGKLKHELSGSGAFLSSVAHLASSGFVPFASREGRPEPSKRSEARYVEGAAVRYYTPKTLKPKTENPLADHSRR